MLLTFSALVWAQVPPTRLQAIKEVLPVLDSMYQDFHRKNHEAGYIYGVVANGKLIHTRASGLANRKNTIPIDANSAFHIASMSKSITAMAILTLRDEGKMSLDDAASTYIPELNGQQYLTTDAPAITIRHLLTHAAGFPEDNPWGDRQLGISDSAMLQMIGKGISFSTSPGTTYEYSNMGFAMLGYIITKVSGQSYQQYTTEKIFKPLGMHDTYWDYEDVPPAQLVTGYRWVNNAWAEQPMLKSGAYGAMGGLITTMNDFSKYLAFHLSAWPPSDASDKGPLKRHSLREMHKPWNIGALMPDYTYPSGRKCPLVSAYGYGLRWTKDCSGITTVGHSGGLPGFGTEWRMLPEYGIGIITFINQTYAPAGSLNIRAVDTLIRLAGLSPEPVSVSAILQKRKEELIRFLPDWKNAEQSELFAENFFLDNFIDTLRKESRELFTKAGKIREVGEMVALNNLRGTFLLKGEKAAIEIYFTLTPENPARIQQLRMRLKQENSLSRGSRRF